MLFERLGNPGEEVPFAASEKLEPSLTFCQHSDNPAGTDAAMSLTAPMVDSQVSRFCWQNLQVDPAPVFPDAELLRDELAQETIYERVFSDEVPLRPPRRYQVKILKALIARIESSIEDWDQHVSSELRGRLRSDTGTLTIPTQGFSDNLTLALSHLLSQPLPSETDAAQQRDYVVYHLSLLQAQPTTPNPPHINLLESRSLISASGTTGLRTWEAALHLGQYLCADPSLVRNKRVLELGTGTGYLAVLCAKYLESDHVMASDGSDEVVNHLSDSFFLNGLQGSPRVTAMQLRWGHALVGAELEGVLENLDTVLGADITYDVSVIPALVATLEDLTRLFPGLSVLIAATERNRATFESFLDVCAKRGFTVGHESFPVPPRSEQNGPFYSDATPIHICKLRK
jgi:predicted nicotinamide N-methyase